MATIDRLGLNFRFDKATIVDKAIAFARASTATRINPTTGLVETVAANVPRLCGKQELSNAFSKNLISDSNNFIANRWGCWVNWPNNFAQNVTGPNGGTGWSGTVVVNSGLIYYKKLTAGITYTVSCWVKASAVANITFGFSDDQTTSLGVDTNWTRLVFTAVCSAGTAAMSRAFEIIITNIGVGGTFCIADAQVEQAGAVSAYEANPVIIQRGLLIEGQATNLLERLSVVPWYSSFAVDNNAIAPNGNAEAWQGQLVDGSNRGLCWNTTSAVPANGTNVVFSIWLKASTFGKVKIGPNDNWNEFVDVTTSWRRYFIQGGFLSEATRVGQLMWNSGWAPDMLPAGSTLYCAMPQIEVGTSIPSSNILTTNAAVTREADISTVDVSKLWNPKESTLICEADFGPVNGGWRIAVDGADADNLLRITQTNPIGNAVAAVGPGSGPLSLTLLSSAVVSRLKVACALAKGALSLSANGSAVEKGNVASPSPTALRIGAMWNGAIPINGTIQSIQYVPYAMDDLTLRAVSELK